MTSADWDVLLSTTTSDFDKISALAERAVALGLQHPMETTTRKICAIKFACADRANFEPRKALCEIREWKKLIKKTQGVFSQGPATYPPNPAQLQGTRPQLYQRCYGDAGPIAARINHVHLARMELATPCRSTKRGCSDMAPFRRKASLCDSGMQQALMDAFAGRCLGGGVPPLQPKMLPLMDIQRSLPPVPPIPTSWLQPANNPPSFVAGHSASEARDEGPAAPTTSVARCASEAHEQGTAAAKKEAAREPPSLQTNHQ